MEGLSSLSMAGPCMGGSLDPLFCSTLVRKGASLVQEVAVVEKGAQDRGASHQICTELNVPEILVPSLGAKIPSSSAPLLPVPKVSTFGPDLVDPSLGVGRALKAVLATTSRPLGRGGCFKHRAQRDPALRKGKIGSLARSGPPESRGASFPRSLDQGVDGHPGLGPDLVRRSASHGVHGGLCFPLNGERPVSRGGGRQGRGQRLWGRDQLVWVGSSSSGNTNDSGVVDRRRNPAHGASCTQNGVTPSPCTSKLLQPFDREGIVAADLDAPIPLEGRPHGKAPLHSKNREHGAGVKVRGGDADHPTGMESLWSDIVKAGKESQKLDRKLEFIPPSLVAGRRSALCSVDGLKASAQKWKSSLVGRVLGGKPYFLHLKKSLERSWRMPEGLEMFSRSEGIFIVNFTSEETCTSILEGGPWFFEGKLVLLRRWELGGASERALLHKAPLWIKLPLLPLEFWSKEPLSTIVSVIGTPLCSDRATAAKSRLAYARCCVEVGFDDDLPDEVPVTFGKDARLNFMQDIIYEWRPLRCEICKSLNHDGGTCRQQSSDPRNGKSPSRDHQRWRPVRAVAARKAQLSGTKHAAAPGVGAFTEESNGRDGISPLEVDVDVAVKDPAIEAPMASAVSLHGKNVSELVHRSPPSMSRISEISLGNRFELLGAVEAELSWKEYSNSVVVGDSVSLLGVGEEQPTTSKFKPVLEGDVARGSALAQVKLVEPEAFVMHIDDVAVPLMGLIAKPTNSKNILEPSGFQVVKPTNSLNELSGIQVVTPTNSCNEISGVQVVKTTSSNSFLEIDGDQVVKPTNGGQTLHVIDSAIDLLSVMPTTSALPTPNTDQEIVAEGEHLGAKLNSNLEGSLEHGQVLSPDKTKVDGVDVLHVADTWMSSSPLPLLSGSQIVQATIPGIIHAASSPLVMMPSNVEVNNIISTLSAPHRGVARIQNYLGLAANYN